MSLSDLLAQQYVSTDNTEAELEKQAQQELYVKLASEYCAGEGIDFAKLSQEDHEVLWTAIFTKEAEEEKKDEPKKEEKKDDDKDDEEKAKAEFAKEKMASDSLATSEALGRNMARAFDAELQKIASEREASVQKEAAKKVASSNGSAIDLQAGRLAVKIASDGNYDMQEAAGRVEAVLLLGAPEGQKIASGTFEDRITHRALELLKMAGYPVNA